jgi:transglutaminase-like putative cysteine protease
MKRILSIMLSVILLFAFTPIAHAQIAKDQYYARSTLSGNELEYYDALYESMINGKGLDGSDYVISEERENQIINYVYNDAPEIINFYGVYSSGEVTKLNEQLHEKAQEILSQIDTDSTDYEKTKYVYNYLAKNIEFDYDTMNNKDNGEETEETQDCQTVVGGLIKQKAVCSGISDSLQYVLYQANIPCITVYGTHGNGDHQWNMIQLDGQWYNADLTADMYYLKHGMKPIYFLVSDDFIKNDHSFISSGENDYNPPLPQCPERYKPNSGPIPTPRIKSTPASEPTALTVQVPPAPEAITEPESNPDNTLWYIIGCAAIAVVALAVILAARRKKKQ